MIILKEAEKANDKVQTLPLLKEILNKLGIIENFLNLTKGIYATVVANIILHGVRLNALPQGQK